MSSDNHPRAQTVAQYFLEARSEKGSSSKSLISQMSHRIELVKSWGIEPGSRVLELGCGQGDCTVVLADTVGEKGHVDAVDPGAPDYGAPFTLSQAQAFISAGDMGPRVTFHNINPLEYLSSYSGPAYDYIVMSHCLWYFESPEILRGLVRSIEGKTMNLCLAEWSLRATNPVSQPHVLTALLLSTIEAKRKIPSDGNIRTVMSPQQITKAVLSDGKFELLEQDIKKSHEGLLDSYWEVSHTLRNRENVLKELVGNEVGEKELAAVIAMYDSLEASVQILPEGEKSVKSMDVWVAKFKLL